MTHLAEAPVGRVDVPADDSEVARRDSFAQQIILGKERVFVEASQFVEPGLVEQHEHARCKWLDPRAGVLKDVISGVEEMIPPVAVGAPDIGGQAMQLAAAHLFDRAAQQGTVVHRNVRIDKQDVRRLRQASSGVATDGRQAAGDHADVEPIAHGEGDGSGAVG